MFLLLATPGLGFGLWRRHKGLEAAASHHLREHAVHSRHESLLVNSAILLGFHILGTGLGCGLDHTQSLRWEHVYGISQNKHRLEILPDGLLGVLCRIFRCPDGVEVQTLDKLVFRSEEGVVLLHKRSRIWTDLLHKHIKSFASSLSLKHRLDRWLLGEGLRKLTEELTHHFIKRLDRSHLYHIRLFSLS